MPCVCTKIWSENWQLLTSGHISTACKMKSGDGNLNVRESGAFLTAVIVSHGFYCGKRLYRIQLFKKYTDVTAVKHRQSITGFPPLGKHYCTRSRTTSEKLTAFFRIIFFVRQSLLRRAFLEEYIQN